MFTGIITHTAKLEKINKSVFTFKTEKDFCKKLKQGSSVSVNGACLTVLRQPTKEFFSVELMPETLRKTMFGKLKLKETVNLERPISAGGLLDGHVVQGHVDGIGLVEDIKREKDSRIISITVPKKLTKYIVDKGSITVNGISLTVIEAGGSMFSVGIIPYTLKHTMLGKIKTGDQVNIEVDIIAKYLAKLVKPYA